MSNFADLALVLAIVAVAGVYLYRRLKKQRQGGGCCGCDGCGDSGGGACPSQGQGLGNHRPRD